MKKIFNFIFLCFVILIISSCEFLSSKNDLETFKSKAELMGYLNRNNDIIYESPLSPDSSIEEEADYTDTNTQQKNVDEGDVIKTDGKYIYFLSYNGLKIIEINNGSMQLKYEEAYENYVPIEMYVMDNEIIVIGGLYNSVSYSGVIGIGLDICDMFYTTKTDIRIYDFTDITNPLLKQQLVIDGSYQTSRITNNTFYYFINSFNYYYMGKDFLLPLISDSAINNGVAFEIDITKIHYLKNIQSYYTNFLIVGKLDLDDQENSYNVYLGAMSDVYVSDNNIYLYFNFYNYNSEISGMNTLILKIALNSLAHIANVKLDGYINNRFSLDEYRGFLRVATTTDNWSRSGNVMYSNLYIFDKNLRQTAHIGNIAPGERIFSARFNEDSGSIVTFRQIDPLFKLDLSNPFIPKISEGLKEEGVSLYLHYIEGTDYSIGIGRDTEALGNDRVIWKGLKITLYDNSGVEAVPINTIIIGNASSYAEVLYNPKALLYDRNLNFFAFAAEEWNYDSTISDYYSASQTKQGLYVFSFENGFLEQKAVLSNFEEINYNNWYDYYDNYYSFIRRGARIGNYIYTISEKYICSYQIGEYILVNKLQINEFPSFRNYYY